MRRAFSWGLPLYAAIMTGVFIGKCLPDNNLQAASDAAGSDTVKAAVLPPMSSPPPAANANANSYPIPAPVTQPKHLFHLVVRYEGDGLPDQSMIATALVAAGQGENAKPKKAGKSKADKAKDMFQFIIRYEGDGIIDDNVAKVLKDYFAAEKATCVPPSLQGSPNGPSEIPEPSEKSPPAPAATPRNPAPTRQATPPPLQDTPNGPSESPELNQKPLPAPAASPRNSAPTPKGAAPAPRGPAPASRGAAPAPRGSAPATVYE